MSLYDTNYIKKWLLSKGIDEERVNNIMNKLSTNEPKTFVDKSKESL